ncbi:unnamed protein product [Litomosoides sigmodontis]|uniref:Uncharacterized protein n=1 Tax=Litomosoides sigmodontis TaxID=42156 RepID=A0A3P7M4H3_LITSI|nr:unnamed protein product [Litomosoides sigmodontis]
MLLAMKVTYTLFIIFVILWTSVVPQNIDKLSKMEVSMTKTPRYKRWTRLEPSVRFYSKRWTRLEPSVRFLDKRWTILEPSVRFFYKR